jgi:hypothetical protein
MTTRRRRPRPTDVVTRGGLTRREAEQGYIAATPEQNRAFALAELRHSRDAETEATIWHDEHDVEALANTAGVLVQYVHVELGHACTVEYRTVDGRAVRQ